MQKEKIQIITLSSASRFLEKDSIQAKNLQDTASKVEKFILVSFLKTKFKIYQDENIYFINIPRIFSVFYIFKIKKEVNKILNKNTKTIITAGNPFDLGILGVFLKFLLKLPLNIQIHIYIYSKYFIKSKKRHFFYYLISFLTLPSANSIRTVGNETFNKISKLYKKKYIRNIPEMLGIKVKEFQKDIENKNIKFLCVARFDEQKNLFNLLNAFIKFNKNHTDVELKLIGGGHLRQKFEELLISNNSNSITLENWTDDIGKDYFNSDFCILTSVAEGYGMVVVESMQYGKPFLATPFGGATYLIKEGITGFVAKDFSEESIYDLLEKAYINKNNFNPEIIKESVKDLTKENMDKELIDLWKNTN